MVEYAVGADIIDAVLMRLAGAGINSTRTQFACVVHTNCTDPMCGLIDAGTIYRAGKVVQAIKFLSAGTAEQVENIIANVKFERGIL